MQEYGESVFPVTDSEPYENAGHKSIGQHLGQREIDTRIDEKQTRKNRIDQRQGSTRHVGRMHLRRSAVVDGKRIGKDEQAEQADLHVEKYSKSRDGASPLSARRRCMSDSGERTTNGARTYETLPLGL